MNRAWLIAISGCLLLGLAACQSSSKKTSDSSAETSEASKGLIKNFRQLTFDGKRSGEGYFSPDSAWMVFQSEREQDNPFYQIYLMNLQSGEAHRVSPGYGKTTCSWIHPSQKKILFSSTHLDPQAKKKQKAELEERASGKTKRYAWDYDETYELFASDLKGKKIQQLTKTKGYDAEGSYSPDGKWIAFASNRAGYSEKLSQEDQALFDKDPSYMMDIYLMKEDGTSIRRLTTHKGYDGGPFFSPDGQRITWRRFSADGHQAEIYTMKTDGTDVKKLTSLNSMSWAPFYHPSGDYLIFTTNIHGYHNFELYIVDSEGKHAPVRASFLDSFDGLPVFLPNGHQLAWSRKMEDGQSQIFISDWDDQLARKLLELPPAKPKSQMQSSEVQVGDLQAWVKYLSAANMKGRMTGSPEEEKYSDTLFQFFKDIGLKASFQNFEFVASVDLSEGNLLKLSTTEQAEVGKDWLPLAISKTGDFTPGEVVFAGYGIVAPAGADQKPYDSYENLDVKDKWVMVQRFIPEEVDANRRAYLNRYARIEHKVMLARNRGAKGVILVSGPSSEVKNQLIPLQKSQGGLQTSLPVVSISDELAQKAFNQAEFAWKEWLKKADKEETAEGAALKGVTISAQIRLQHVKGKGRSTIGFLQVPGAKRTLFIGAHGDHLGTGPNESSLSRTPEDAEGIHYGADDNASGVSVVMELAHYFSNHVSNHKGELKNNIAFVVWSGEELGNLGSQAFVEKQLKNYSPLAYLNFDMVGRLKQQLNIQGVDSSTDWRSLLEPLSVTSAVPITQQQDPYLPTDAISFYTAGVPVLSFFTGGHPEYHTVRDTADLINYTGIEKIAGIAQSISEKLARRTTPLQYQKVKASGSSSGRKFRIFLGTIPDYTSDKIKGVKLTGVIKDGPAEQAGLKTGDVIVEFGTMKIENIYDYVYTLETLKPGQKTKIVVLREGERKSLDITPSSRQ